MKSASPITLDEMLALMNVLIRYSSIHKDRPFDFSRFDSLGKTLLEKYSKFQKVSTHRIANFLPRLGEHPEYKVKNQLQRPFDPAHPNAAEDFAIPVDFPPKTVDIYADLNAKYTGPLKNAQDADRLIQLLALDIRWTTCLYPTEPIMQCAPYFSYTRSFRRNILSFVILCTRDGPLPSPKSWPLKICAGRQKSVGMFTARRRSSGA